MHIEQLTYENYRNYAKTDLTFDHNVNVIIGENAQGKTNLLEAIYVLAMTKSHRTAKDKELIRWEEPFAKIQGQIKKRTGPLHLEVVFSSQGKKVKLNRLEQERISQYIGALNIVMFAPEDLRLVKGSPKERRRFIDMEMGQISPIYLYHLSQYHKILKQRNRLLKDAYSKSFDDAMLDVLTAQLIPEAAQVIRKRYDFLNKLQVWANDIHEQISRGLEHLKIEYVPSAEVSNSMNLSTLEEKLQEQFNSVIDQEKRRATTLVGPHRDDLRFIVNDKNVQTYGSQGQQRTVALSLKLAEIELIHEQVKEYPILLLDDVLSELDDHRQSHLLSTIQGKVQTFVTTTSVDGIDHKTLNEAELFRVENGEVVKKK
ncbi:DNA replication/repair protein RecF [Texcoconibacillus texcoconensis]|uniref:DNA replication and repair protein RecF n=1 Tax=Texcoconibacillus texcoconensis TaxID=1095777 RepID=A0A840QU44_9BACI|nr:DNA replication and repair protein RecF [Texcoconibacillus texcoconensis]